MKNKLLLGFCIITAFTIASCKKNSVPKPPTDPVETKKDTDVYVCGFLDGTGGKNVAVYWKNGVITKLTDGNLSARAEAITVVDNDVYISGVAVPNASSYSQAVYWKNGVLHVLTDSANWKTLLSDAAAITVKDNKVYAAGSISTVNISNLTLATSWENGVENDELYDEQEFPEGSRATGIAFKGNEVYIVGSIKDNNINLNYNAAYWKHTPLLTYLPKTKYTNSEANAVCVKGNDVYIAGHNFDKSSYRAVSLFWKNDVPTEVLPPQPLPTEYTTHAYAISADSSNNVYMAGSLRRNGEFNQAVYWKNAQQFNLADSDSDSGALGVATSGNDVYVVGYDFSTSVRAVLWKNGTLTTLHEAGQALGIAVVVH